MSEIAGILTAGSTDYPGLQKQKHQSSTLLAFYERDHQ